MHGRPRIEAMDDRTQLASYLRTAGLLEPDQPLDASLLASLSESVRNNRVAFLASLKAKGNLTLGARQSLANAIGHATRSSSAASSSDTCDDDSLRRFLLAGDRDMAHQQLKSRGITRIGDRQRLIGEVLSIPTVQRPPPQAPQLQSAPAPVLTPSSDGSSGTAATIPRACEFWNNMGRCKFGASCRFRHGETLACWSGSHPHTLGAGIGAAAKRAKAFCDACNAKTKGGWRCTAGCDYVLCVACLEQHRLPSPPPKAEGEGQGDGQGEGGVIPAPRFASAAEALSAGQVALVTLTNTGYLPFTANCQVSLDVVGEPVPLTVFCADGASFDRLRAANDAKGPHARKPMLVPMHEDALGTFLSWKQKGWARLMWLKCEAMRRALSTHEFVVFTDGDITYERRGAIAHCVEVLLGVGVGTGRRPPELVIQNDGLVDDMSDGQGVCAGFMAARATPATLAAFTVNEETLTPGWDDQRHLNALRGKMGVHVLPLDLFPNGQYWQRHKERLARARPGPLLVHYNWLMGAEKRDAMSAAGRWYVGKEWDEVSVTDSASAPLRHSPSSFQTHEREGEGHADGLPGGGSASLS